MVFSLQNCFSKKSEGTNVKNFVVSLGYRPFTGLRYKKRFEMRNTKLYSILQNFDKYEQNRLRKFLESPYFNRSEAIVQLFELLTQHINDKNNAELEKECLWKSINPEDSYDDVRFRKYCSDLLKLIEGYLSQVIYEDQKINASIFLIRAVGKKKLTRFYADTIKNAKKLQEQSVLRSSDYYLDQYLIEKNYYDLQKHDRFSRTNVEEINRNLDYFYLSEKLRYYCFVLSRQDLESSSYQIDFIDEIINHIKQNNIEEIPSISIYYQILLMLTNKEDLDHYFKLKVLLEKNSLKFPNDEANSLYDFAINYCVMKINQGEQKFLNEIFDLYIDLINKKIIIADGELSPWHFRNITVSALRLGKFEWTENFIKEYQYFLANEFRKNAVTYNLAQAYFYQKKYDEVKLLLQEVEFDDFSYNLNSKSMLLAVYYETDDIEPLYSFFESFRTYLNRHKDLPVARRQLYSNLIRFTKKLTNINSKDKKAIQKLKQDLESTKNVASHAWLMEKIAELE